MEHKYVLLKDGRGIVVIIDVDEILNPSNGCDIIVIDRVFLKIDDTSKVKREIISAWVEMAIKEARKEIYTRIGDQEVCFLIKKIDINYAHFQVEGLYCAMLEWLAKYYGYSKPDIPVFFDKASDKFIFDIGGVK